MSYLHPKYPKNTINWLSRFDSSLQDQSQFAFFNEDPDGYQRVKLFISPTQFKNDKHLILRYYQKFSADEFSLERLTQYHRSAEYQRPLDLTYLQGQISDMAEQPTAKVGTDEILSQSLWVNKYSNYKFMELLTDETVNRKVLQWLRSWDKKVFAKKAQPKKINAFNRNLTPTTEVDSNELDQNSLILLGGPPGCGKTTLARTIASFCKYNWVQINASDNRTAKALIQRIDQLTQNNSVSAGNKPTMVIIDEADGMVDREENGIKEVLDYIIKGINPYANTKKQNTANNKKTETRKSLFINRPLIFICNDPYAKCLRELRKKAVLYNLQKIRLQTLVERLKDICKAENVYVKPLTLQKICQRNNCDIRSSIGTLEFLVRCRESNNSSIEEALERVKWESKDNSKELMHFINTTFTGKTLPTMKDMQHNLMQVEAAQNLILDTFYENYLNRTPVKNSAPNALQITEAICYSDELQGRAFDYNMETNSFLFLPYYLYKLKFKERDYVKIEFPREFFDRLAKARANREELKRFKDKLQAKLRIYYSGKSLLLDMLPVLMYLCRPKTASEIDVTESTKFMLTYNIELEAQQQYHTHDNDKKAITYDKLASLVRVQIGEHHKDNYLRKPNNSHDYLKIQGAMRNLTIVKLRELSSSKDVGNIESAVRLVAPGLVIKPFKATKLHYKYVEGTSTKIRYKLPMSYFFGQDL